MSTGDADLSAAMSNLALVPLRASAAYQPAAVALNGAPAARNVHPGELPAAVALNSAPAARNVHSGELAVSAVPHGAAREGWQVAAVHGDRTLSTAEQHELVYSEIYRVTGLSLSRIGDVRALDRTVATKGKRWSEAQIKKAKLLAELEKVNAKIHEVEQSTTIEDRRAYQAMLSPIVLSVLGTTSCMAVENKYWVIGREST